MAWTQAQADALREAIATGATTVMIDGKTVSYRNLNDMLRLLRVIENSLSASTASDYRRVQFGSPRGVGSDTSPWE